MPWSVYQKHFTVSPMTKAKSRVAPLSVSTMAYIEYDIARELGLTYTAFRQLPRKERKGWMFYFILKSEKEQFSYNKAKEEADRQSQSQQSQGPGRFR